MKIAVIGTGNMGAALARAFSAGNELVLMNRSPEKAVTLAQELGAAVQLRACNAALGAELVLLAVKPNQMEALCRELAPVLEAGQLVVSVAAGVTTEMLEDWCGGRAAVVRAMPNTPAAIGAGVTLLTWGGAVTAAQKTVVLKLFSLAGLAEELDETLMDAAAALTGCSPAFVYMFIEAMADAAVRAGLPRQQAYRLAAAAVRGAAAMVQETGQHPAALKDAVCSPGGSTIEGVAALERCGMRAAVMEAMRASAEKNSKL